MGLEIERKYLIKDMPSLDGITKIEYERYFISDNIDEQIRVQRKNDTFEIEKKIKVKENEYKKEKNSISKDEFENLIKNCDKVIKRDSYLISSNPNITVKVYHGKYEGLRRVEVEFNSVETFEKFESPSWFGKEITNTDIGMDVKLIKLDKETFFECLNKLNESEKIDDLELDGLRVIQNKEYFCFGMDSILLANFVQSNSGKNIIVDFCSGSGVIPIVISAKNKYRGIVGIELQNEMFDLLERNILLNNLCDKIIPIQSDIKDVRSLKKKILEKYNRDNVDIIVCNPPYKKIGTGVQNENSVKYIARHEVRCTLEDIFSSASKLLKSRGKLYLVHKPDRLVDLLVNARKYNLEAKKIRFIHPKADKEASIVLVEYVKDSGSELSVCSPLIEYDKNGNYTDEIYSIYGKKDENNG